MRKLTRKERLAVRQFAKSQKDFKLQMPVLLIAGDVREKMYGQPFMPEDVLLEVMYWADTIKRKGCRADTLDVVRELIKELRKEIIGEWTSIAQEKDLDYVICLPVYLIVRWLHRNAEEHFPYYRVVSDLILIDHSMFDMLDYEWEKYNALMDFGQSFCRYMDDKTCWLHDSLEEVIHRADLIHVPDQSQDTADAGRRDRASGVACAPEADGGDDAAQGAQGSPKQLSNRQVALLLAGLLNAGTDPAYTNVNAMSRLVSAVTGRSAGSVQSLLSKRDALNPDNPSVRRDYGIVRSLLEAIDTSGSPAYAALLRRFKA